MSYQLDDQIPVLQRPRDKRYRYRKHDTDFVMLYIPCSSRFKNHVRYYAAQEFPTRPLPSLSAFTRLSLLYRIHHLTGMSIEEVLGLMQCDEPHWWHGSITADEVARLGEICER